MHRASINQLTTYRWDFAEDVYHFQKAGFTAIGVWRRKLSDFGEERGAELLRDAELRVNCLGWAGGFTGCDGKSLDEAIVDGLAAISTAALIEAKCLVVYTGGRNNHISSHADRLLRHALEQLLMAAEVADVVLAIKPMRAACAGEWTYLTNWDTAVELVEEYRSPHFKLVYDCYQFPEVADQPDELARLVPDLGLVQLADARIPHSIELERCPLGQGVVPVMQAIAAIDSAGYKGPIDVELMGSEIALTDYAQLVADTYETMNTYLDDSRRAAVELSSSRPL